MIHMRNFWLGAEKVIWFWKNYVSYYSFAGCKVRPRSRRARSNVLGVIWEDVFLFKLPQITVKLPVVVRQITWVITWVI